ncbi:MAG: GspH/FimT family pseudopilin [Pseudoxanthomonas sp.]
MSRASTAGFTLIELMVALAVLAILVALAAPSFQNTLRSNRVATATNELLASLALARTEAIRSTNSSGVCASTNGAGCDSGDWNDGWMVWTDVGNAGIGTYESTDTIVRYTQPKAKVQMDIPAAASISFDRRGRMSARGSAGGLLPSGPRHLVLKPDTCPAGLEFVRTLTIGVVGQVRVQRSSCP